MPEIANPRRQSDLFWREMEQLKAASICIRLCRNKLGERVRALDLVKAFASSGGIAGWVVWRDYPFLWSAIIAAAQLTDAMKPVFPFARQYKAAGDLTVALELLFIDAQYEWERIYAGMTPDEAIMEARRKIQTLRLEAEQKSFPEGFEPPRNLVVLAAEETRVYMKQMYDAVSN
jgi:hypothetical protein